MSGTGKETSQRKRLCVAGDSALLRAIDQGDVHGVRNALEEGVSAEALNPSKSTGKSPLELAVQKVLAAELAGDGDASFGAAIEIVKMLVAAGANLFGSEDVSVQVELACSGLPYDFHKLAAMSGSPFPESGAGVPPLTPVHLALQQGSLLLVQALCTLEFVEKTHGAFGVLHDEDDLEGGYHTLQGFVAWTRGGNDATKVAILEYLFVQLEKCGLNPLQYEYDGPGMPASEYPLLHGLLAPEHRETLPDAGFFEFVTRLLQKHPALLKSFDRHDQTAYVKAAGLGLLPVLRFLEGVVASMPPDDAGHVNLANPTAGFEDFQTSCQATLDTSGVWCLRPEDGFTPVLPIMAAAVNGQTQTLLHLLANHRAAAQTKAPGVVGDFTEGECTQDGCPSPSLVVMHATRVPAGAKRDAYCVEMQRVLDAYAGLDRSAFVDLYGNTPLHVAASLQVASVAERVAAALASNLALATSRNEEGFTALDVARQKKIDAEALVSSENATGGPRLAAAQKQLEDAEAVHRAISDALSH